MYMYINLKGIIQFTEIWFNLRFPCASSSALTLITEPYTVGVFVLTKNKQDLNQWAWQGSTVGPSLYYPCLVKIRVQYNIPLPMLHGVMHMSLYFCVKFSLIWVSTVVLNPAFFLSTQNSVCFPLIEIIYV